MELSRRNIPFVKFGGLKFLEAAHIKDVLALLRWAENLRDRVSGFRVIQLLPGVGPVTAARVLDQLSEANCATEVLTDFRPPAASAASPTRARPWRYSPHDLEPGRWPRAVLAR